MARRGDARIRKQEHLRNLSHTLLPTAEQLDDSTRPTLTFCNSPIGIAILFLVLAFPCSVHLNLACVGTLTRILQREAASVPTPDFESASNTAAARKVATTEMLHGHGYCGTEQSLRQRFVLCHVIETYISARLQGRGWPCDLKCKVWSGCFGSCHGNPARRSASGKSRVYPRTYQGGSVIRDVSVHA